MKTKLLLTIQLVFVLAGTIAADSATRERFKYQKKIKPPADGSRGDVFRVELDSDVYDHADRRLGDLRLFRDDDSDVPFRLRRLKDRKTTTRLASWPGKVVSLEKLPDNRLELVVENPRDDAPTALTFATPMRNYEKTVQVLHGDHHGGMTKFGEPRRVYDFTGIVKGLKDNEIALPGTKATRYSLVFDDFKDSEVSPFRRLALNSASGETIEKLSVRDRFLKFDSITFLKRTQVPGEAENVESDYPLTILERKRKDDATVIVIESKREPLNSIEIVPENANFARDAILEASDHKKVWRTIAGGTLFNVDAGSVKKRQLILSFPESRRKYYLLTIQNGDNPPVNVTRVAAKGAVDAIECLATERNASSALYYGGDVPSPNYDAALVIDKMASPSVVDLTFGPESPNPLYDPAEKSGDGWLNSKITFVAAVIVMIAALAAVLFKSAGKIPDASEPNEPPGQE